jgi:putative endonuclease
MAKQFFVYMTASKRNGTLYVGVTSDLPARAWQHNNKVTDGFTAKYNVDQLVFFEPHERAESASWGSARLRNGGAPGRLAD